MAKTSISKYGCRWNGSWSSLDIEFDMIRILSDPDRIKRLKNYTPTTELFDHYKAAQTLIWPADYHNRWSDLILKEVLKNTHTAVLGPKDAGKTYTIAKFALVDYWVFPQETLILMTTDSVRGLELRVWGAIKDLWRRGKELHPELCGFPVDHKHSLCTDSLGPDMDPVRDMRKGIIGIPCRSSTGAEISLNNYVGLKQKRRRLLSDEVQFLGNVFLEAPAALGGTGFKGVYMGHPLGQGDALDKLSEPKNGWGSEGEITKTTCWQNKFKDGRTVNLVGTDSPNFDYPSDQPPHFDRMIHQKDIDEIISFYGKDSTQYWSKCLAIRKPGLMARRVITIKLCEEHKAFDPVIWMGKPRTKVYYIDAAYGSIGGDRCIGGWLEFGEDHEGTIVIFIHPQTLIPVTVNSPFIPEDQIAMFVKSECEGIGSLNIPPQNVFYDSTGRGSLGTSFGRIWSSLVNPVEFGGAATDRPVSDDLYISDPLIHQRRLKLCYEEFSKRVTEFWFMFRYAVEANQIRGLPRDVAEEGSQREWKTVSGGRVEIETKSDMRERTGESPDKFDGLVTGLEGARRLGFKIKRMVSKHDADNSGEDWFDLEAEKYDNIIKSKLIQHS